MFARSAISLMMHIEGFGISPLILVQETPFTLLRRERHLYPKEITCDFFQKAVQ